MRDARKINFRNELNSARLRAKHLCHASVNLCIGAPKINNQTITRILNLA